MLASTARDPASLVESDDPEDGEVVELPAGAAVVVVNLPDELPQAPRTAPPASRLPAPTRKCRRDVPTAEACSSRIVSVHSPIAWRRAGIDWSLWRSSIDLVMDVSSALDRSISRRCLLT